jgi:hypothetical protein
MNATHPEFQGFPSTQRETADEPTIARFLRLSEEKGPLVPQAWLPEALGVSKALAYRFLSQGRFHVIECGNTGFVSLAEVEEFKATPRPTGRPKKA